MAAYTASVVIAERSGGRIITASDPDAIMTSASVGNARPRTVLVASMLRYTGARIGFPSYWSAPIRAAPDLMRKTTTQTAKPVQRAVLANSGLMMAATRHAITAT